MYKIHLINSQHDFYDEAYNVTMNDYGHSFDNSVYHSKITLYINTEDPFKYFGAASDMTKVIINLPETDRIHIIEVDEVYMGSVFYIKGCEIVSNYIDTGNKYVKVNDMWIDREELNIVTDEHTINKLNMVK